LENLGIVYLREALIKKEFSVKEITQYYLKKIDDKKELNAFITINEDCLIDYECIDYSCKFVPREKDEEEDREDIEKNGNGICLILPLILLGGLFVWKKKLN